jgi:hypothetical protein
MRRDTKAGAMDEPPKRYTIVRRLPSRSDTERPERHVVQDE